MHGNSENNGNSCQVGVDQQLLNCDQGPVILNNNSDLLLHQDSNHDSGENDMYSCEICGMSYNCHSELTNHNNNMHDNYSCEQCEFVSFGQFMMQDHISSSHLHLACDECEFVAKNKGGLTRHRNAKHQNHSEPNDLNHLYLSTEDREEPTFLTINFPEQFFLN